MSKLRFIVVPFLLIQLCSCDQIKQPVLECRLSSLDDRFSANTPAQEVVRRIKATLSDRSQSGVWQFDGTIDSFDRDGDFSNISGHFHKYDDGTFDLIATTDGERITVMPSNALLKLRGLTGVTMRNGETVSSGSALTATCHPSFPTNTL